VKKDSIKNLTIQQENENNNADKIDVELITSLKRKERMHKNICYKLK